MLWTLVTTNHAQRLAASRGPAGPEDQQKFEVSKINQQLIGYCQNYLQENLST